MKLTGKCKEEFLKQLLKDIPFYDLPECCQNALIIEFFDSVGIICLIGYNSLIKKYYWNIDKLVYGTNPIQSRIEATNAAIIKANDLFNSK